MFENKQIEHLSYTKYTIYIYIPIKQYTQLTHGQTPHNVFYIRTHASRAV